MGVVTAAGHHCKSGGREMYDGRITYPTDEPPEMVEIDGALYWRVPEVSNIKVLEPDDAIVMGDGHGFRIAKMTPEDGMRRETRGASV